MYFISKNLILGKKYKINNNIVTLIKVSKKGFNFLLSNNRLMYKSHLYSKLKEIPRVLKDKPIPFIIPSCIVIEEVNNDGEYYLISIDNGNVNYFYGCKPKEFGNWGDNINNKSHFSFDYINELYDSYRNLGLNVFIGKL